MIYKKKKDYNEEKIYSNLELIHSIFNTQMELSNATNNYEYADGELIDFYSYNIKANKSKLDYLIKKAKNRGIIIDNSKQIELKSEYEIEINQYLL